MAIFVAVLIVKLWFTVKTAARLSDLIIQKRMRKNLPLPPFRPRANQFAWEVSIAYAFSTGALERPPGKSPAPSLGCPLKAKAKFLHLMIFEDNDTKVRSQP